MRKVIIVSALLLLGAGNTAPASDVEIPSALLDGTTIVYSYLTDWSFDASFNDGRGHRKALAGEYKSEQSEGFPYAAHRLDNGIYIVQWDEMHGKDLDFVTLQLNFNTNQIFASSLLYYGTSQSEPKALHFEPGIIHTVERK